VTDAPDASSNRETLPTRKQALIFSTKARVLRWRLSLANLGRNAPAALRRLPIQDAPSIAESRTPLYSQGAAEEWALQAGKVHNLRLAARALHGRVLAPGEVFSFWANVGRASRRRGFVEGRELREGCIIPSVGGGLCQLSNALYEVALQSGAEILERHAHSRRVPGSSAAIDRDATVFWNYVDLRFRAVNELQLTVELTESELFIRLHSVANRSAHSATQLAPESSTDPSLVESCETCGATACFRHPTAAALPQRTGTAWIVDAFQPEHDAWMATNRTSIDSLLLPLDSSRWGCGPYRWTSRGFVAVHQAVFAMLRRSWISRRLSAEGAARQRALLEMDEQVARALAKRLPPLATHLVISQNLLPFLWRDGLLGGRTFDVLMTRLPFAELEAQLDRAAQVHPQSSTLADFRAPDAIVHAEQAALARAQRWITPHTAIAALAGARACLLKWQHPSGRKVARGRTIVFPASTLGRKGAYELRAAIRGLDLAIRLGGPVIESAGFWRGVTLAPQTTDWLADAAAIVLPAWVEHQPRRLLQAVAAGVPVIASDMCGLATEPGVTNVPVGDVPALRAAVIALSHESVPAST